MDLIGQIYVLSGGFQEEGPKALPRVFGRQARFSACHWGGNQLYWESIAAAAAANQK